MGLYAKYVLPRLIDGVMSREDIRRRRAALIPEARGRVIEIGMGSGLNLPFYSREVKLVCGVDPSAELTAMAEKGAARARFPVEFVTRSAEDLPLDDRSFDTAVVTWSLCSIPDAVRSLEEVRRVLRPGGRLLFIEHGRSPDSGVRAWQNALNPAWKRLGGGCNLNRPIDEMIRAGGFRIEALETGYADGPRPMAYLFTGSARP